MNNKVIVTRVLLYEYSSPENYLKDQEHWTKEYRTLTMRMSTASIVTVNAKEDRNG